MMKKRRYMAVLAGTILTAVLMAGCGATDPGPILNSASESGTDTSQTTKEQELQKEVDALKKELNDLKSSQGNAESGSADTTGGQDQTASQDQTTGQNQTAGQNNTGQISQPNWGTAGSANVQISLEQAQQIALDRVPGATASNISIHLDFDDGWYLYEGDIIYNSVDYEFEIDANTGTLLKWEEERW